MRVTKAVVFPVFLFIVAYGYGQDVHYNYAPGTNFSAYKTYQWVEVPSASQIGGSRDGAPKIPPPSGMPLSNLEGMVSDDQLIAEEIKRAVDEQLAEKALTKVEQNGDLQVAYHLVLREEKGVNLFGSGWAPDRGWGGAAGSWDASIQGQTSTIPVGTLLIDLYDSGKKQLIWRGDASKSIELKKDPNKNYKTLEKAMAKLFKNYPPQTSR